LPLLRKYISYIALLCPASTIRLPCHTDYGFGVKANDRLLVERYISGQLIGCDTLTRNGKHLMLGVNEKMMYPPPSSAIKGSCFPANQYDVNKIQDYVFSILDALEFNDGVTHTEILLADEGPFLVEVNPRLVGAKIPRLLNLALDRSIHRDVIDLHLGKPLPELACLMECGFAVSRWIISDVTGILEEVILPAIADQGIRHIEILKKSGDSVSYPYQNADRIGYIMTLGETREQAERIADDYIAQVRVKVSPAKSDRFSFSVVDANRISSAVPEVAIISSNEWSDSAPIR
jgi:predicted ATP-grasp superfamily ATP-dependent carboligase